MPVLHSRRFRRLHAVRVQKRLIHIYRADHFFEHFCRDGAGPEDHRRTYRHIQNCRLKPDVNRTAIQDHINLSVQVFRHVLRRRRTGAAGRIGAWRGNESACRPDQSRRHRINRHTDRNRIEPPCCPVRNRRALLKDHGKRTRPEMSRQHIRLGRNIYGDLSEILIIRNMNDQRIIRRTPLRCIGFSCGFFLKRIRSEAIHCLRWKCNQPAVSQNLRRFFYNIFIYSVFIDLSDSRFHKFYYTIIVLKNKL